MNTNKRMRLAVIPAVFAALALAGCQDEAPTTVAPTAAQQTSAPSAAPTAEAPTAAPTTEAAPAPSTAEAAPAPSSSAPAPANGVECDSTGENRPGDSAPKPLGSKQTASVTKYGETTDLAVTVGKPTKDTSSSDSFFPGEGMEVVIYPTTIQLMKGSYAVVSYMNVSLIDPNENPCKPDVLNKIVPESKSIDVTTLKGTDSVSGQLAFAVPVGADLTKYKVIFASKNGGKAELAWNAG